jgi:putative nucleotidyltransferase with HDIG domain
VGGVAPLVAEISAAVARNPSALIDAARLTRKDDDIHLHSVAVCVLMIHFARALELDEQLVRELGLAGLLHDIGKVGVPDALLKKPDKLSDAEYTVVREHSRCGYELIVARPDAPAIAAEVVLHHHERYDGMGYPHGLKGDAISLYARMAAICDVYDAITSNRPYSQGRAPAEAIARMLESKGQFDPRLLDIFIRSIGIYPVGCLVRLRSNRLAIVVSENRRQPTRPRVKAFYAVPERVPIRPEIVPIGPSFRDDAILTCERPEHWNLGDWPALRAALLARG